MNVPCLATALLLSMPVHSAQNPDRNRSTHRQVARVRRLPLLNINRFAAVFAGSESGEREQLVHSGEEDVGAAVRR